MKINTTGLVISEQTVSESDKLITVITKDLGVIRAFVKSARSIKSRNSVATQLLTYSNFVIYKGNGKYVINEADVQELFFELRVNIEKLTLAQYFCEIAIVLGSHEQECKELLRLFLNALYYLAKDKIPMEILKSIVEIRAMSISGFMPDLVCCCECGCYQSDLMYLLLTDGKLVCSRCFSLENYNKKTAVTLDKGATAAFRHIIYSKFKDIFSFSLDDKNSRKKLSLASERYLLTHTGRTFKTLNFYTSLFSTC